MSGVLDRLAGIPVDAFGLGVCLLILIGAGVLAALLWQTWPRWVPHPSRWRRPRWRMFRLRLWTWRWPWRRKPATAATPAEVAPDGPIAGDHLPDVPAATLVSLADRLAAEGRYAESVRERLRAMVRELVDAGLVENRPSLTVSELARSAATRQPPMGAPLGAAVTVFSDIWYGERTARADHDDAMRAHAAALHDLVHVGVRR